MRQFFIASQFYNKQNASYAICCCSEIIFLPSLIFKFYVSQCAFKYQIKLSVVWCKSSDSSFRGESLWRTLNSKIITKPGKYIRFYSKLTWSVRHTHCEHFVIWYLSYSHLYICYLYSFDWIQFIIFFHLCKSLFLSVCIEQSESIYHKKHTRKFFIFFFRLKTIVFKIIDGLDGGGWSHLICLNIFFSLKWVKLKTKGKNDDGLFRI